MGRSCGVLILQVVVARGAAERVLGLEDSVGDQLTGMFVLKPIEHALPFLSSSDDSGQAQFSQMLGYGSGRFIHDVCQMIDREFAISESKNQANASGIGQHRKHFDCQFHELTVWLTPAYLLIRIHTQIIARQSTADLLSETQTRTKDSVRQHQRVISCT